MHPLSHLMVIPFLLFIPLKKEIEYVKKKIIISMIKVCITNKKPYKQSGKKGCIGKPGPGEQTSLGPGQTRSSREAHPGGRPGMGAGRWFFLNASRRWGAAMAIPEDHGLCSREPIIYLNSVGIIGSIATAEGGRSVSSGSRYRGECMIPRRGSCRVQGLKRTSCWLCFP